jgi:hypothetical protein
MRAQTQGQSQRVEHVSPTLTTQASKQLDSHGYTDWIGILN